MYFSKSSMGFFSPDIHDAIPEDAVELSERRYLDLLAGQSSGQVIAAGDDGYPVLVDREAPSAERVAKHISDSRAYAYRTEADPLFFKVQRGEAEHQEWLDKVAEIKLRFPKPDAS